MNNVVVTVLHLLRALHRRIIVIRILCKMQRIRASLATAIYGNKRSDWFFNYLLLFINIFIQGNTFIGYKQLFII